MHGLGVLFGVLAGPGEDNGFAVVVHLEHEFLGAGAGVAEVAAEDVGHVGHEVDGVVPDNDVPGGVCGEDVIQRGIEVGVFEGAG